MEIINTQLEIISQIDRIIINFKKTSESRYTIEYLNTKYELLESYWSLFRSNHLQIIQSISPEVKKTNKYFKEELYNKVQDTYVEFKTALKENISDKSLLPKFVDSEQYSSQRSKLKLPRIELPKFSGEYSQWMYYKDLFTTLIHNDPELSDIQKHHYLRSSLKGEAEQLLKYIDITDANYQNAWSILKNRYNNQRIIAHTLLNRLFSQKKLTDERGLKELVDTTKECLSGLKNLGVKTDEWDIIIIHILISKIDSESHKRWEERLGASTELPNLKEFTNYLEGRFRAMEMLLIHNKPVLQRNNSPQLQRSMIKAHTTEIDKHCTYCNQAHYISHCTEFAQLEVEKRKDFVKNNRLCFNCLIQGHLIMYCRQSTFCKKCGRRHHTLLHEPVNDTVKVAVAEVNSEPSKLEDIVALKTVVNRNQVLLMTAKIAIKSKNGCIHHLRALIDPGAQASFITEHTSQLLNLDRRIVNGRITGISDTGSVTSKYLVTLEFYSTKDHTYSQPITTDAYVLRKLTSLLPTNKFSLDTWPLLKTLDLADSQFHSPGSVDVLLGADIYSQIILDGIHKHNTLIALNSVLGWLISGKTAQTDSLSHNILVSYTKFEVDQLLRKFWEIEEHSPEKRPMTSLEVLCEKHYRDTHTRDTDGRYIVRLPFKDNVDALGNSRPLAVKRLLQTEQRFKNKPQFHEEYCKFMRTYEEQGHMKLVSEKDKENGKKSYYLPHHAVIRESSITTKLRVVFDASCKPENGSSLNDQLLIGPPILQNIRQLVTRWRKHKICMLADIKQMYRQILVSEEDVDYQRIVWRENSCEIIKEYQLLTVTYGTSCAPYLAMRTLHQLAEDEKVNFPAEAPLLKTELYMDDIMIGESTEKEAIALQGRITELCKRGGFVLHKWSSNSKSLLKQILENDKVTSDSVHITLDESVKALGISWNPTLDSFELNINFEYRNDAIVTKRTVLATIAKTFDPLGWLAPIVVVLKIFMQKLWLIGLNWDDELPQDLKTEWCSNVDNFTNMEPIRFSRWLGTNAQSERVELHGFCDASCAAFAAVLYLRVIKENSIYVTLLSARTKVAPIKRVSLPRLELCAAVLLARMVKDAKTNLKIEDDNIFVWTDATIVLAWLKKYPNTWKDFVANRTTEILNVTSSSQWHHINSADNPADIASRGINPTKLKDHDMWWHGPALLGKQIDLFYPKTIIPDTAIESKSNKLHVCVMVNETEKNNYIERYSRLSRLIRVTAYILRFIVICRNKLRTRSCTANSECQRFPQYLTTDELKRALDCCIKISQELHFYAEIQVLRKGGTLSKTNKLYCLTPYVDIVGYLRVYGRLRNALIDSGIQSPIILSSKCHLAKLIVLDAHIRALHGGPQLTLNFIRTRYWIIGAKNLVKKVIHECLVCFKQCPATINQLMGQLPRIRVTPNKPFSHCGVDYAGPVMIKLYPGRCNRSYKAYICLFICTTVKAIHLELVSELSSAAFLAAFRRFVSRRGRCSHIYSDCATNFVGASRELNNMFKNSRSQVNKEIAELLANDGTTWHFIPPGSPHFGGLWEAGVKSVKTHLKRVLSDRILTFEEYYTLLTQVEACVNSRPLYINSSKDDELAITPGHFLLLESPVIVPEPTIQSASYSPLQRWKLIQSIMQHLWTKWSLEYLTSLQNGYKWAEKKSDIELNTIVLIKDERLPPGKWLLGRIIDKHPGKDGLTRVVTIKCKENVIKRPITKICPLPSIE